MPHVEHFEDLLAWRNARELVRSLYELCGPARAANDHGLCDRLCRAAVAAMSDIAEGYARRGNKDVLEFLDSARGALADVQSLLYVALDVGYIRVDQFEQLYQMAEEAISHTLSLASFMRRYS
jgi:four helix bundle protein